VRSAIKGWKQPTQEPHLKLLALPGDNVRESCPVPDAGDATGRHLGEKR
jgi:hypothetical protein